MADFHGHQLTDVGRNLLAKILAGKKVLTYTKVVVGDGELGSTLIASLTAVISPKLEFLISQTPTRNSIGRWNVTAVFTNRELQTPFYFREWAVFAQDPDSQQDVLVLYANAGKTADLIPVWDGSQESTLIEEQLTCACVVDSEISVTALIDPSQIYTPESEFLAHKNDKNNPHGVTAAQIGAAPTSHTHSPNDLTAVVPESKGGTGQTSLQAARNAMGLGNTLGVLPVANGGTGQSSLANVTVGKATTADTAASSSKLTTKRTIALSGAATGTATGFDGSANITIPVTALDMSKATAGTLPAARGGTGATSLGSITVGNSSKWGNYTIWKGTQAQYDGLSSKSSTTVYFIVG